MNPDVISPNMDRLAAEGVILDRNYAQPICSPSRAALMSGVYPYKMGRQVCFRNSKYLSKIRNLGIIVLHPAIFRI